MYSWYPPDVLMISPTCFMISPDVLNIPRCTHDIPPMYSWYPSDVLNTPPITHDIPPMYSWYPPMYSWYPPDVLNTPDVLNISRCTEHTLYRVIISGPAAIKALFPLVLRIVRIRDAYDFPILGFLRLLRFLGQPGSHSSEESPTACGIYL